MNAPSLRTTPRDRKCRQRIKSDLFIEKFEDAFASADLPSEVTLD